MSVALVLASAARSAAQIPDAARAAEADGGSTGLPFLVLGLWVLLLAVFVGFELIAKVPPTLHTPLMSGSNAISGITLVGALYCVSSDYPLAGKVLGVIAIALATINVVGGFLVTDRMLRMFGGKAKRKVEKA